MQDAAPNCEVSPWGDWSDCSSKCDSGSRTRNRRYLFHERSSDCNDELYEVQPCRGNEADCPPPREAFGMNFEKIRPTLTYISSGTPQYQPEVTNMGFGNYGQNPEDSDPACQTSNWSDWSPCSKKCGSGFKRRTRLYLLPFVPNRSCDVRLYDKQDCYGSDPSCEDYGSFQNFCKTLEIVKMF